MRYIKTNKGELIKVDNEDFEYLNTFTWHITRQGYPRTKRNYKHIKMHSLLVNNPFQLIIDHKDRDKLNNQRNNLRLVSPSQNCQNRGLRIMGSSNYKGVSRHSIRRKKGLVTTWIASIMVNGIRQPTKSFKSEIEAAIYYNKMAKKLHGKFAVLNHI